MRQRRWSKVIVLNYISIVLLHSETITARNRAEGVGGVAIWGRGEYDRVVAEIFMNECTLCKAVLAADIHIVVEEASQPSA